MFYFDLEDLIKSITEINRKNWFQYNLQTRELTCSKVALIQTAVFPELFEAVKDESPNKIEEELGDIVIRILDFVGQCELSCLAGKSIQDVTSSAEKPYSLFIYRRYEDQYNSQYSEPSFGDLVLQMGRLSSSIGEILQLLRRADINVIDIERYVERAFEEVCILSWMLNVDLQKAVTNKLGQNKLRGEKTEKLF